MKIILVIDAIMGQDAINVIRGFNNKLPLTGIVNLIDGDTKGGVALSVQHLTNIPIKFVGDSEKLNELSPFLSRENGRTSFGYGRYFYSLAQES